MTNQDVINFLNQIRKMLLDDKAWLESTIQPINEAFDMAISALKKQTLPSEQPTLYGYNVEHLILIASVLQKENLPPERITEALTDIGRVVAIVRDEFEEALRKVVEQCKI